MYARSSTCVTHVTGWHHLCSGAAKIYVFSSYLIKEMTELRSFKDVWRLKYTGQRKARELSGGLW